MENYSKLYSSLDLTTDEDSVLERVNFYTSKRIKEEEKKDILLKAISFLDLTTLEGKDTKGRVAELCAKAINPKPGFNLPSCAAVCVYPSLVSFAKSKVKGTDIKVASVATAFPSGQFHLKSKLEDVRQCIKSGADEIDMVISRGAFLERDYDTVFNEIKAVKNVCLDFDTDIHLKVILETGEIETLDNVRKASIIAMNAGADFIKTSTGKINPAATLPVTLVMLEAINDFYISTGKKIGMKPAGGIRTDKDVLQYLMLVSNTLGDEWLNKNLFRIGASSVLDSLVNAILSTDNKI